MKQFCFALDLQNEPELIQAYDNWHQHVWPEIIDSIQNAGIANMKIYRIENRLFMIMQVNEDFSFEKKSIMDSQNLKVQEWEKMMSKFQQPLPFAKPGEKWMLMHEIFSLK